MDGAVLEGEGTVSWTFWNWHGKVGRLTTPPPPSRDVFAALTIQVVARFVMDVRMRETLALSAADGAGRMEVSAGSAEEGWRVPSL